MIRFQPLEMADGEGPKGQDPPLSPKPVPAAHERRYSIGEHPSFKDSVGLQLQTGDGWETYKPVR